MTKWLHTAIALEALGNGDTALDEVYLHVDDWCMRGMEDRLNDLMADPVMLTLSTDLLLGILTASRGYRSMLPNRAALCKTAHALFTQRGEDADDLLRNLDIP